jgi:hypothetical protein
MVSMTFFTIPNNDRLLLLNKKIKRDRLLKIKRQKTQFL